MSAHHPSYRRPRSRRHLWLAGATTSVALHAAIVWALLTWTRPEESLSAANRGGGEPVEAQWVDLSETRVETPPVETNPEPAPSESLPPSHVPMPMPEPEPEPEPTPEPEPEPEPKPRPDPQPEPRPAPSTQAPDLSEAASDAQDAPEQEAPAAAAAEQDPDDTHAPLDSNAEATTTEPGFSAGYLDNPPPAYPRAAQRLRQEGEVRLRVVVDADGKPVDWSISRSSGHERLDRAAMDAVAQWRFEPATRGGKAVEGEVIVPMRFQLR